MPELTQHGTKLIDGIVAEVDRQIEKYPDAPRGISLEVSRAIADLEIASERANDDTPSWSSLLAKNLSRYHHTGDVEKSRQALTRLAAVAIRALGDLAQDSSLRLPPPRADGITPKEQDAIDSISGAFEVLTRYSVGIVDGKLIMLEDSGEDGKMDRTEEGDIDLSKVVRIFPVRCFDVAAEAEHEEQRARE
jgi:hypothetical protein